MSFGLPLAFLRVSDNAFLKDMSHCMSKEQNADSNFYNRYVLDKTEAGMPRVGEDGGLLREESRGEARGLLNRDGEHDDFPSPVEGR